CFFSGRRRHTRFSRDWSSDVCASDLGTVQPAVPEGDRPAGEDRACKASSPRHRAHKDHCGRKSRRQEGLRTKIMPKRILQGTVVSDKNDKTVVVKVERRFTHPVMKKTVRMSKKYKAHDENNVHKVGDVVFIQESAPISRDKRWVVLT